MKILKQSPGVKPMDPIIIMCKCCEAWLKVDYSDLEISFNGRRNRQMDMYAKFVCPCCEETGFVQSESDLKKIHQHCVVQKEEELQ